MTKIYTECPQCAFPLTAEIPTEPLDIFPTFPVYKTKDTICPYCGHTLKIPYLATSHPQKPIRKQSQ